MTNKREFYKATILFEVNGVVVYNTTTGYRYGKMPDNYSFDIQDFDTFVKRADENGFEVVERTNLFSKKKTKEVKIGWNRYTENNFKNARKTVTYTKTLPADTMEGLIKTLPYDQFINYIKDTFTPTMQRYFKG